MDNLETIRTTLDELYETWRKAIWAVARPGSLWVPASLSCIPVIIWWAPQSINLLLILFVITISSFYVYFKYSRVINYTKQKINELESDLLTQHQLYYCGCDTLSHYFNPESKKLWNIKNNIYFDNHAYSSFETWHNRFHNPYKGSKFGNKLAVILGTLLVLLTVTLIAWKLKT